MTRHRIEDGSGGDEDGEHVVLVQNWNHGVHNVDVPLKLAGFSLRCSEGSTMYEDISIGHELLEFIRFKVAGFH